MESESGRGIEARTTPPVPRWMKTAYGVGSVAYGVKENGLSYFLLIYYNQILGLEAAWVGLALLIALLLDGISDPIIGYISDRLNTKWGRRHPFMYFAAIPSLIVYFYLWNPPADLSQMNLFLYLVSLTVLVRTFVTFYETPSTSLVAEITDSYHERTSILSLRYFFGWWGGLTMALCAYTLFLVPTESHPVGQLNPQGYEMIGVVGSVIIFISILISTIGTHFYIPYLKKLPQPPQFTFKRMLEEMTETLKHPSFLYLFGTAIFSAMGAGIVTGLSIYLNTYFWGLTSTQIFLFVFANFFSAVIALIITKPLSSWLGKKIAAILTSSVAFFLLPLPVLLRIMDILPANGGVALYHIFNIPVTPILNILLITNAIDVVLIIASSILLTSMIADLVEDSQIQTGRRSEGLFFASRTFVLKAVSGLGVLFSTLILSLSGFPEAAEPGKLDPDILQRMGLIYAVFLFTLYAIAVLFLTGYKIDQKKHESNLNILSGGSVGRPISSLQMGTTARD